MTASFKSGVICAPQAVALEEPRFEGGMETSACQRLSEVRERDRRLLARSASPLLLTTPDQPGREVSP
jgi:hypothetical protein